MVDRKFNLMAYQSLNVAGGDPVDIQMDEVIPVDFHIHAIHRIFFVGTVLDVIPEMITDIISPTMLEQGLFLTLSTGIPTVGEDLELSASGEDTYSYYVPSNFDHDFFRWLVTHKVDDIWYSSKFVNIPVKSNDVLNIQIHRNTDSGSSNTTGIMRMIYFLECEVD